MNVQQDREFVITFATTHLEAIFALVRKDINFQMMVSTAKVVLRCFINRKYIIMIITYSPQILMSVVV